MNSTSCEKKDKYIILKINSIPNINNTSLLNSDISMQNPNNIGFSRRKSSNRNISHEVLLKLPRVKKIYT